MNCYVRYAKVLFTRVPLRNFEELFPKIAIENEGSDWKFELLYFWFR